MKKYGENLYEKVLFIDAIFSNFGRMWVYALQEKQVAGRYCSKKEENVSYRGCRGDNFFYTF